LLLNEHIDEPGDVVFRHACKLGLEGIVSKRLGSRYRSGLTALGQEQEPGSTSGQAGSRRGLGKGEVAIKACPRHPVFWLNPAMVSGSH
jgi:hypothetical protein